MEETKTEKKMKKSIEENKSEPYDINVEKRKKIKKRNDISTSSSEILTIEKKLESQEKQLESQEKQLKPQEKQLELQEKQLEPQEKQLEYQEETNKTETEIEIDNQEENEIKNIEEDDMKKSEEEVDSIEMPEDTTENKKNKIGDMNINLFNKMIINYKNLNYSDKKAPNIHNAHGALYFLNNTLCDEIVKNAIINIKKDIVGMVTLDYTTLYNSLANNDDLISVYKYTRSLYDDNLLYNAEYTVTYTNMMNRISKIDERIKLTNDNAYNFLIFLLLKTTKEILRIADIIRISGKKGTLNENHITDAVKIVFGNRHLAKILINKILDGVKTLSQNKSKNRKKAETSEVLDDDKTVVKNESENNVDEKEKGNEVNEVNEGNDDTDDVVLSEDEM